jgi:glyoxylase-like metal-dependent hydrolase (beta-lactamase superfamily II)
MTSWQDFAVLPPHTEFDESLTLPGGVVAHHVGGRHAEDSTVVAVPDADVLLLGDCFYPPPYHLREPGDGYDIALIRRLLDGHLPGPFDWYVGSHDQPRTRDEVHELVARVGSV